MNSKQLVANTVALGLLSSAALADGGPPAALSIIPHPVEAVIHEGHFALDEQSAIVATGPAAAEAAKLAAELRAATGLPLPTPGEGGANTIRLTLDPGMAAHGPGGYRLRIGGDRVDITAPDPAGIYYAGRSLLQMTGPDRRLPRCEIRDYPRFGWRGLMLDCSRTFQSVDYLRATLDRMAFYKLNVLHLHLTDDQGWRLEIKAYPELTRQGARFAEKYNEPPERQGFYTRREMAELIAYAADRHITIVPEIEMPGHTLALLSVMPHLSCTGGPFEVFPFFKGPNITKDIFCAGNDETFRVLEVILGEVAELFPSKFIHIGGDEAPKNRWQECERCQRRIREQGLKDEAELQSWFIRRASAILAAKGKRLIGWDEILEGGLAPGAAVMSWRGTKGGIAAATAGHDVVLSPTSHCYFDYNYEAINSGRVFSFDPLAGFPPDARGRVLGIQANFWSHIDRAPELVDRQLFPRLLALAERAWAPADGRDWDDYLRRARAHLPRLQQFGAAFHAADLPPEPATPPSP
ncbi:MAG: beta-N-acetylhexosaminidase [Akkermansiaceae bacterium]|nr:beta-N-acetylhexosaminidase [Akkermansiaceae bacterium]